MKGVLDYLKSVSDDVTILARTSSASGTQLPPVTLSTDSHFPDSYSSIKRYFSVSQSYILEQEPFDAKTLNNRRKTIRSSTTIVGRKATKAPANVRHWRRRPRVSSLIMGHAICGLHIASWRSTQKSWTCSSDSTLILEVSSVSRQVWRTCNASSPEQNIC